MEIKNSFEEYREKVLGAASDRPEKYMIRCLMTNGRIQNIKWSKFLRLAEKFRDTKERDGLRDGDRVYLLTPYTADALLSFAVLSVNHLTVVFGDPGIPKEELIYQTGCTEISAVFADRKLVHVLDGVTDVPLFSTFGLRSDMALVREAEKPHAEYYTTPESLAIIFSSGTTSRMKPVEITYEAMLLSHKSTLKDADLGEGDMDIPSIKVFPMNHISGLAATMSVLQDGFTGATVEKLDSASLVKVINIFEPKTFSMVPKVLAMFINRLEEELRKQGRYDLYMELKQKSCEAREKNGDRETGMKLMEPFRQSLFGKNMRNIYSGGGPCPPELAKDMQDLGLNFVVNYSSTECGVPIAQTDSGICDCYDCVGRADRDPNVRIKINEPDTDGIGEIYVNSRYIMKGYYNDPEKTEGAFDGEWFRTGDNGYIDERGYLHISGRSKDSIMLESGKKVSPDDIEMMLLPLMGLEIPYSVVGVTDKDSGYDKIHIFIAGDLSAEKKASIAGDIRSWQRTEAALYPIEGIHFIRELPKTSIGKIKRVKLREMVTS
ncbi:MAG: class I adenylate-forming enzyme family protein, partial [Candidatus Limivicinus sp.]